MIVWQVIKNQSDGCTYSSSEVCGTFSSEYSAMAVSELLNSSNDDEYVDYYHCLAQVISEEDEEKLKDIADKIARGEYV